MATAAEMQAYEEDKRSLSFANPADLVATIEVNFDLKARDVAKIQQLAYSGYGISSTSAMIHDRIGRLLWLLRSDMDLHEGTRLVYRASQHASPIERVSVPDAQPAYSKVVQEMQVMVGQRDLADELKKSWLAAAMLGGRGDRDLIYRAYWHATHPTAPPIENGKLQAGDRIRLSGSTGIEGPGSVSRMWFETGMRAPLWRVEYLLDTPVRATDGSERLGAVVSAHSVVHERDWPMSVARLNTPDMLCVVSGKEPVAPVRLRASAPAP